MIPDREEDIKPRFHKSKIHGVRNDSNTQVCLTPLFFFGPCGSTSVFLYVQLLMLTLILDGNPPVCCQPKDIVTVTCP